MNPETVLRILVMGICIDALILYYQLCFNAPAPVEGRRTEWQAKSILED